MKNSLIAMVFGITALASTGALAANQVEWGGVSDGRQSFMMMVQSGKAFSSGIDVSTLEKVIDNSSRQMSKLNELNEQMSKLNQQNSEYSRSLSQQSDKISSLESKISSLESKISSLESKINALESKIK